MAYDPELARRIRVVIADDHPDLLPVVTERAMFGGLAFLVRGNMAVAAGNAGDLMLRCDRDDTERHLAEGAEPTVMRGREMSGWLDVSGDQTADDQRLTHWVAVGMSYAARLPAK